MPGGDLRVLGPVEVVADDGTAIVLPAKQVRLLATLVVAEGAARQIDELVEAVWSGSPPASARNLVQVYVSQLRKVLPAGIRIVTRGHAYAVELDAGVLDAARFERLLDESVVAHRDGNPALATSLAEQGLALWRGRAYGELAYEDLARAESERLEELRLVALEERLDARLDLDRHDEVLGEALALAEDNPYRERIHRLAMLALYRSGRQKEALEHYAAVREHLSAELGLEPGPELRELQRRILEHDPELSTRMETTVDAGSLPVPPSPLVGRQRELDQLGALLARRDARLIVLTGAGGTGKTRLALEAARQAAGWYANGVALIELAPLRDPALVIPTIARTLGVAEAPGDEQLETLGDVLAPQELLLLVDNAEHVRDAAPAFARLVARAPRLTLLVTSRAVLHVSGGHVFPVLPLPEEDAMELFVQRAQLLEPTFARTNENEEDLREICRRVDGLPLAIELAAARIRALSPQQLRDRLGERLAILTGGPRDLPARQQTLRQTVEWSVGLLDEPERDVLARLAVFPAGATLEAAEQVCDADIDTLSVLVDDHLVERRYVGSEPRFGMLETVREYALGLLGGERTALTLAMGEYFARWGDDVLLGDPERDWMPMVDRLDPDIDNVRAALAAASASGETYLQLRLAGGLWRYWWVRGLPGEGLGWIEQALAADEGPPSATRANALYAGAGLAWTRGDNDRARELALQAIPVAIDTGSTWTEVSAHTVLGLVAIDEGDHATARRYLERAIELKAELGAEPVVEKLNLGVIELDSGNPRAAEPLFEEVLAAHRRSETTAGIGYAQLNLGLVHHALGDHAKAREAFEEGRSCFELVGYRTQVAYAMQGLAACEASESRFEETARLLGQAYRELDDIGSPRDRFASELVMTIEQQARAALGDATFEALAGS